MFNAISIKIPMAFFHINRINNPKIYRESQEIAKKPKQS